MRVLDLSYDGRRVYSDHKGYALVWVDGRDRKVHVLEWERHFGPKPEGHEIHHRDEDKGNWSIDNLELLTNQDHQRLHAGWVKENGEWAKKPCTACGALLPISDYYARKGYTPTARCKPCHNIAVAEWASVNREKRRAINLAYYHRSKANA